jgi:hypothetical protein
MVVAFRRDRARRRHDRFVDDVRLAVGIGDGVLRPTTIQDDGRFRTSALLLTLAFGVGVATSNYRSGIVEAWQFCLSFPVLRGE